MVINRNTIILFMAQCMFVSGTVLMVTIGGIVGTEISPTPVLATLPMSLMIVGTAIATIPASLLMQRFGRRVGFTGAALLGIAACLLGVWSLEQSHFVFFCTTATLIGIAIAFSQQFRFAAAESVAASQVSQAISFILLGSIGGALLGPALAAQSPEWTPEQPFKGAFWAAGVCYLLAAAALSGIRNTAHDQTESDNVAPARSLGMIIVVPAVIVAVLAGVVGQGVMTFVMTATPVSMHVVDGHSLSDTASVIRSHVLAMYLPSLFSGVLISWFGSLRIMFIGIGMFAATIGLGMLGHEYLHYWGSLVLLGVGWNFLFVGGTTMLVTAYQPSERFRVQAFNDFSVFGVSAVASLMGGAVLLQLGWDTVLLTAALPLLLMLAVLWRLGQTSRTELAH